MYNKIKIKVMKLINLTPEESKHVVSWLSPEGKVYSLLLTEQELGSSSCKRLIANETLNSKLLTKIAEMICRKKAVICDSPKDYLLNHGWVYYCSCNIQKFVWIWDAKEMNYRQLTVAKAIDNNESLQSLVLGLK